MKFFAPLFTFLACLVGVSGSQEAPKASNPSPTHRLLQGLPPGVAQEIGILLTTIGALDIELVKFETPITLRFTNYFVMVFWNCVAVYDDAFFDTDTGVRPTVVSPDSATFTSVNRAICASQAALTYSAMSMPTAVEGVVAANAGIGIDLAAELDGGVAACVEDPSSPDFISCLQAAAADGGYSPIIMGQIVAMQAYLKSLDDGWNQLGTAKPGGLTCQYHCRNYTDPTGFAPVNSPYDKSQFTGASSDRWQPLLEDNNKGFFYYQEHVTPHIGTTGKFRYVPETERASFVAPDPMYQNTRQQGIRSVIDRMAALDDIKKMQVEAFDDKILVANSVVFSFVLKVLADGYIDTELGQEDLVLSYERLVHFVLGMFCPANSEKSSCSIDLCMLLLTSVFSLS